MSTGVARDDVNMGVLDDLPGGETVVEADVKAIRLEAGEQALADLGDQRPDGLLFGCVE